MREYRETQLEDGKRSRLSERHGGTVQARVTDRRDHGELISHSRFNSRSRYGDLNADGRVSKVVGGQTVTGAMRDSMVGADVSGDARAVVPGSKVAFYFTNFSDSTTVFQLRQLFEVCGILSDIYIARKQNL